VFHSPNRAIPADAAPGWSRIDTAQCLARAIAELNALVPRPDITVITGDLVNYGNADEYANLRQLLMPLRMPVYLIPGNHDSREELRRAFADAGYFPADGFLQYAVDDYPLRLVALDTVVAGEHNGELCAERLEWFEHALAVAPHRPTVVLMHHPPFATGLAHMDRMALRDPGAFAAIVARHPQIERILCGHLHRAIDRRFAGTVAGTAPATAHQLPLALDPEAPAEFIFEPPGYQLHLWREGDGLVTHTAVFGDWPGPYPYQAVS
jgi:3',5'-cyclic AMP phosphodiesterase CpdA